jgi:predicted nucleic acid-binding protein
MTALFADTFYWVALADFADSAHQRALALTAERAESRIVTTDEVLAEYLTFFSTAPEPLRREAAESVAGILASSAIRVVPQSRESFLAGLELYRARPDKGYSLVDCISMQAMRQEGLTEVLTNDRHFEQEGFRALFRDL